MGMSMNGRDLSTTNARLTRTTDVIERFRLIDDFMMAHEQPVALLVGNGFGMGLDARHDALVGLYAESRWAARKAEQIDRRARSGSRTAIPPMAWFSESVPPEMVVSRLGDLVTRMPYLQIAVCQRSIARGVKFSILDLSNWWDARDEERVIMALARLPYVTALP